jgi:hypothetical protein
MARWPDKTAIARRPGKSPTLQRTAHNAAAQPRFLLSGPCGVDGLPARGCAGKRAARHCQFARRSAGAGRRVSPADHVGFSGSAGSGCWRLISKAVGSRSSAPTKICASWTRSLWKFTQPSAMPSPAPPRARPPGGSNRDCGPADHPPPWSGRRHSPRVISSAELLQDCGDAQVVGVVAVGALCGSVPKQRGQAAFAE